MPSNEQRRQAAKRKLERQLERRAERARKRKQMTIGASVFGVVLVVAAGAVVYSLTASDEGSDASAQASETEDTAAATMPTARAQTLPATVDCSYVPDGSTPAKAATLPNATAVSAEGTVTIDLATSAGPIGLALDRAESPCTVNSFVSLTTQGYFNDTPCHRLSTTGLMILQCGDPTGQGTGGPGYGFDNEFPTDQYDAADPAASEAVTYPRGTVAMANTGQPGSNGSQFFLVYDDSPLPPQYTVFGTISEDGLATIEQIAAAGDDGSMAAGGGKPNTPVQIRTATVAA
ncbi:peptidylprolyl isomerase [Rhodococcus sp. NPDC003318]|uniref:peptidylprolyl isomerase n=1 Tax=Rhodococcus sp. NPDC003318 TaxID=3364503 RepID=UPI0036869EC7